MALGKRLGSIEIHNWRSLEAFNGSVFMNKCIKFYLSLLDDSHIC